MELYRISKKEHFQTIGSGGFYFSGRWHEAGLRVIYASQSRSLASLEFLAHLSKTAYMQHDYIMSTVELPSELRFDEISIDTLGYDWKNLKNIWQTRQLGSSFLRKKEFIALKVPSAIVPGEYNFLINPEHKDFELCKLSDMRNLGG